MSTTFKPNFYLTIKCRIYQNYLLLVQRIFFKKIFLTIPNVNFHLKQYSDFKDFKFKLG